MYIFCFMLFLNNTNLNIKFLKAPTVTGVDFLNWLKKGEKFRLFLSGLTFAVERHIQDFPHTGLRLTKKNRERR